MTERTVRAKETWYAGCCFRSRLEARWAVYFDSIGVDWDYEPEGFKLEDGTCYLPDFVLHNMNANTRYGTNGDQDVYVEVKGVMTEEDAHKIKQFANLTVDEDGRPTIENPIYVVGGIPNPATFPESWFNANESSNGWFFTYRYMDGDPYFAFLCMGKNGGPGFFGGDQSYLEEADVTLTTLALRNARSARFDHGESGGKLMMPDVHKAETKPIKFKAGGGGTQLELNDCKITNSADSWRMKLSQLASQRNKHVTIIASYMPMKKIKYLEELIHKHPRNLTIIAYETNEGVLMNLKRKFPEIECHLTSVPPTTMVLIEPRTVWIGSGVFGPYEDEYRGFEASIGIHEEQAYQFYRDDLRRWWDEEPNKHRPLITN